MENLIFSIIFPTYGVEKYLPDAVGDILRQSEKRWELIIVDDASPDGCGAIADGFAKEDDRIRVIHKEKNGGVAAARNSGLKAAGGRYVLFLDPDDRFETTLLQILQKEITDYEKEVGMPPDVVSFGASEEYWDEGKLVYSIVHSLPAGRFSGMAEIYPVLVEMERKTLYGYPWNKCYRRALLEENGIVFPPYSFAEDILFNCDVFDRVRYFSNLDAVPVRYRNEATNSVGRLTGKYLPEYFDLQKMRLRRLLKQYARNRKILPAEVRREALIVLSAEYARSFLSMMERERAHGLRFSEVLSQCKREREGVLYRKLLPHFVPKNVLQAILYFPIRRGFFAIAICEAELIGRVKQIFPTFYNRMKQNR